MFCLICNKTQQQSNRKLNFPSFAFLPTHQHSESKENCDNHVNHFLIDFNELFLTTLKKRRHISTKVQTEIDQLEHYHQSEYGSSFLWYLEYSLSPSKFIKLQMVQSQLSHIPHHNKRVILTGFVLPFSFFNEGSQIRNDKRIIHV